MLHALAGDWVNLRPFLTDDEQLDILRYHLAALAAPLRAPFEPTTSGREFGERCVSCMKVWNASTTAGKRF